MLLVRFFKRDFRVVIFWHMDGNGGDVLSINGVFWTKKGNQHSGTFEYELFLNNIFHSNAYF